MGGGLEKLEGEIAFFTRKFIKNHKSYKGLEGRSSLSSLGFE